MTPTVRRNLSVFSLLTWHGSPESSQGLRQPQITETKEPRNPEDMARSWLDYHCQGRRNRPHFKGEAEEEPRDWKLGMGKASFWWTSQRPPRSYFGGGRIMNKNSRGRRGNWYVQVDEFLFELFEHFGFQNLSDLTVYIDPLWQQP